MKKLKFTKDLVPLVLSGEKTATWRLFDDKDLGVGDDLELLDFETKEPFARAKIVEVVEKPFRDLDKEDKLGHEAFLSNEEMVATYSGYYDREVTADTLLKIIRFELTETFRQT